MPTPRSRKASLAARIVALTLGIVASTVLVSSAIALIGVYSTLESEEAASLVARRQTVLDVLEGRLDAARAAVLSLSAALSTPSSEHVAWSRTLHRASQANVETFDAFVATDASGTVVAAAPSGFDTATVPADVVTTGMSTVKAVTFVELRETGSALGRLWVVAPFTSEDRRYLLASRMRTGFRETLVDDLDSASTAVAVLDRSNRLIVAGKDGPALDIPSARFIAGTTPGVGQTRGLSADQGRMLGYWVSVSSAPELGWRVLVAQRASAALERSRAALFPASLMVVVASLGAMVLSAVFARRLVQPLHMFEESARDVASGILVSPLEVDRDDEIGRLADGFNAMLVRLNALRELSRLLSRSTHLDDVLRGTLGATTRLLGADVIPLVFLLEGGALRLAGAPSATGLPANLPVAASGPEWPGSALSASDAISGDESVAADALVRAGMRSGLALPLVIAGEPIGVLAAIARKQRRFTEAEKEMLRTFAVQAAMAIEKSRLFEEERASRHEAEALRDVAEELESTPDLRRSLDRVAAIAGELLSAASSRIVLSTASGLSSQPRDADFVRWDAVYLERSDRSEAHPSAVAPPGAGATVPGAGEGALLLVPLLQDGSRRGLLVVEAALGEDGFGERQVALATTLGREVSLALENALLLQQARDRANNLERIFRISQAVSSSLQSTVVLNRVLDVVQKIFTAEAVSLMTYDSVKRSIVTAMARGIGDREMLYLEVAPGEDLAGRVFANGRAEIFPELGLLETRLARMAVASGFRSMLAVPLLARGRSIGVLSVYAAHGQPFDPQDVELLQTFATQAALAIDTAQLYGREHRVATVLQASIVPETLPSIPGLDLASVYRPVGGDAEIGGDYFDVFPAPDGRVVLAIADVAGKGVFAATKTSMIRYALRGMVSAGLGPGAALTQLNRMVAEAGDPADIVTVWAGALDIGAGRLTYADAGHPPGLLLRPESGDVERLTPTGPVLGGVASAEYEEHEVGMEQGASVVLYTDGVTEARRDQEFFGEERVRRSLVHGGTAEETANRLIAEVERFAAGGLRDDAAILVVRLDGDRPGLGV